jgi:hypothetical protein
MWYYKCSSYFSKEGLTYSTESIEFITFSLHFTLNTYWDRGAQFFLIIPVIEQKRLLVGFTVAKICTNVLRTLALDFNLFHYCLILQLKSLKNYVMHGLHPRANRNFIFLRFPIFTAELSNFVTYENNSITIKQPRLMVKNESLVGFTP